MTTGGEISVTMSDAELILAVSGDKRDIARCRKAGLEGDALRMALRLVANVQAPISVLAKWYGGGIALELMPEMYAVVRDCQASPGTVMKLVKHTGEPVLVSYAYVLWRDESLPMCDSASNALDWLLEISSGTTGASMGGTVDYYLDFINELADLLGGEFPSHRLLHIFRELFPGDGIHRAFRQYSNDAASLVEIIRCYHSSRGDQRIQVDDDELAAMGVNPRE